MAGSPSSQLISFCAEWMKRPVAPEVQAMAEAIAELHRPVEAVLAYGSCLRGTDVTETLIDYYVLTRDLGSVSASRFARWGCALLPPNVYYIEREIGGKKLRAKYAVLPLETFASWMTPKTSNPYFWARFAQPSALVHSAGPESERRVVDAIATAISTCLGNAKALSASIDPLTVWTELFRATYCTELRSEREDRAEQIVAAYSDYYSKVSALLPSLRPIKANWMARRIAGKILAVLRLIKASFTFQGGPDYLAWKISRHSGVKIELTQWQRRHPVLAAPLLLFKLRRKGAVR